MDDIYANCHNTVLRPQWLYWSAIVVVMVVVASMAVLVHGTIELSGYLKCTFDVSSLAAMLYPTSASHMGAK